MDKQRRNELTYLKYKKRIQKFAATCSLYVNRDGVYIYQPKTIDIINDKGQLIYKTSATPCSCWMCSKEMKYKRHEQKREDQRLIQEGLNEWFE
jgi:hypothetical protein